MRSRLHAPLFRGACTRACKALPGEVVQLATSFGELATGPASPRQRCQQAPLPRLVKHVPNVGPAVAEFLRHVGDGPTASSWAAPASASAKETRTRPLRLALRVHEAAEALGISDESFAAYVKDELPCVRIGTLRLYPVAELERWLSERAETPLEGGGHG